MSDAAVRDLRLDHLTWPEVRDALAADYTTVILASGATEQHGPHLPLLTDADHAECLSMEVATRLGHTLVAPVIRIGHSPHHLAFPGTLSLSPSTFEAVYVDCCSSLARHGFKRICCFSAHGGNFALLAEMQPRLNAAVGPSCEVVAFSDLDGFLGVWKDVVQERTGLGDRVGGHSDIAETSVLAAMHPDLVRWDRLETGLATGLDPAVIQEGLARGFDKLTPNGILGDPHGANAELGNACIAAMADLLAGYFRAA